MKKIASWKVIDVTGKPVASLPYKHRLIADKLAADLNEIAEKRKNPDSDYRISFCVQLAKEPVNQIPASLVLVLETEKIIRGVNEDDYGERRLWTKKFLKLTAYTVANETIRVEETFTAHLYKGQLRIIHPPEIVDGEEKKKSVDLQEFETYAKKRWPTTYHKIMVCLYDF